MAYSFFLVLFFWTSICFGRPSTEQSMAKIIEIAHGIAILQPRLPEHKYIEYAMAVHRASRKYGIRPSLLIAIAHQETSFREELPEGRAGEIGITQILKRWLKNPRFRQEFKNADLETLQKPSKGFLYSAWILRELKRNEAPDALPYWSYYNARQFKHRLRYYSRVNRHIEKIKRSQNKIARRMASLEARGIINPDEPAALEPPSYRPTVTVKRKAKALRTTQKVARKTAPQLANKRVSTWKPDARERLLKSTRTSQRRPQTRRPDRYAQQPNWVPASNQDRDYEGDSIPGT